MSDRIAGQGTLTPLPHATTHNPGGSDALSLGSPVAEAIGSTASDGTATTFPRSDHRHAMPAAAAPVTQAFGDAAAEGTATTLARADHKHGMPANPSMQSRIRAYPSGNQSIPASAWTKISLQNETYDNLGEFDSTTNYRFVAQVAGYYLCIGHVQISAPDNGAQVYGALYINGSRKTETPIASNGNDVTTISTDIVFLAVNDYIELYTLHTSATAKNTNTGLGAGVFFSVHRLS